MMPATLEPRMTKNRTERGLLHPAKYPEEERIEADEFVWQYIDM